MRMDRDTYTKFKIAITGLALLGLVLLGLAILGVK